MCANSRETPRTRNAYFSSSLPKIETIRSLNGARKSNVLYVGGDNVNKSKKAIKSLLNVIQLRRQRQRQ